MISSPAPHDRFIYILSYTFALFFFNISDGIMNIFQYRSTDVPLLVVEVVAVHLAVLLKGDFCYRCQFDYQFCYCYCYYFCPNSLNFQSGASLGLCRSEEGH